MDAATSTTSLLDLPVSSREPVLRSDANNSNAKPNGPNHDATHATAASASTVGTGSKNSNDNLSSRMTSYEAEDPGIMSEAETSATGGGGSSNFKRSSRVRSSLPIVRSSGGGSSVAKPLPVTKGPTDRSLGLVFLQHRNETKRALLPNEITTLDTVKALFVRSFPRQLNMSYLNSRNVRIYIHDMGRDMFYELDDLRDVRDRSVLRVYEQDLETGTWQPVGGLRADHPRILNERMNQEILAARGLQQQQQQQQQRLLPPGQAAGAGGWSLAEDPSYFSEPEFESASDLQEQHIHRSRKERASFGAGGGTPSPLRHSSQSQYYGTIIIPAYRTAALMQQHQQQQQQQQQASLPQAAARSSAPGKGFSGMRHVPASGSVCPPVYRQSHAFMYDASVHACVTVASGCL